MLIDSNVVMEVVRDQRFSQNCRDLFKAIDQKLFSEQIYLTRFSLNAISAMSCKIDPNFLKRIFLLIHEGKIKVVDMDGVDNLMILSAMDDLDLDFDDSLQFVAANKLGTYIVTYDKDFKKTGFSTKTPHQVLKKVLK